MVVPRWKQKRNLKFRDGLNSLAPKYSQSPIAKSSPPTEAKLIALFNALDHAVPDEGDDRDALAGLLADFEMVEEPSGDAYDAAGLGDGTTEQDSGEKDKTTKEFRMRGYAFLCTYNHRDLREEHFAAFGKFVEAFVKEHQVKYWTISCEKSLRSADAGRIHKHFFMQFKKQIDESAGKALVRWKITETWEVNPDIRPNILAVEIDNSTPGIKQLAARGSTIQSSLVTGHFYLAMDGKPGKIRHETNYVPFVDYWPDKIRLDKFRLAGKITDEWWLHYHSLLTVGFARVWEDTKAKRRYEEDLNVQKMRREAADVEAGLRSSGKLLAFPGYEPVEEWLAHFTQDNVRFPVLLLLGPSHRGKTEFAKSLFTKPLVLTVGSSNLIPNGLREYERYGDDPHTGIVFDDVRDLHFITNYQEVFQGKTTIHEFGRSPTGMNSYFKLLYRTPMVFTTNFSTKNLDFLYADDFCNKKANIRLVRYPPQSFAPQFEPFAYPEVFEEDSPGYTQGSQRGDKWAVFQDRVARCHGND